MNCPNCNSSNIEYSLIGWDWLEDDTIEVWAFLHCNNLACQKHFYHNIMCEPISENVSYE